MTPETGNSNDRPLVMISPRLCVADLPNAPLLEGVTMRPVQASEAEAWLTVIRAAEALQKIPDNQFVKAYGDEAAVIAERVFFAINADGNPIGTVAAWYGTGDRAGWGRIHWLYVLPEWQGKGLGRALLHFALRRLAELGHENIYLHTSTGRRNAIRLYERFGFEIEESDGRNRRGTV